MTEITTNSNEKLVGALTYLAGPITGVLFLLIERKNQYIRYHAMQ